MTVKSAIKTVIKAVKAVKAVKAAKVKPVKVAKVKPVKVPKVKPVKVAKVKEDACVWNMGTKCSADVEKVEFFNKQIRVPVCKKHVEDHRIIMLLHKNGYDVEEILQQTPDWRKQEALTIQLAGLNTDDIAL